MNNNFRKTIYVAASVIIVYCLTFNYPSSGMTAGASHAAPSSPPSPVPEPISLLSSRAGLLSSDEVEVTESGDPEAPAETFVVDERALNDALDEKHSLAAFPSAQGKYKSAPRWAEAM